jgi:transposase-like protein
MVSDRSMSSRSPRRRLSPSEKYEMYVAVLTGQCTQREAAETWKVDRSTVITICRTAKQTSHGETVSSSGGVGVV